MILLRIATGRAEGPLQDHPGGEAVGVVQGHHVGEDNLRILCRAATTRARRLLKAMASQQATAMFCKVCTWALRRTFRECTPGSRPFTSFFRSRKPWPVPKELSADDSRKRAFSAVPAAPCRRRERCQLPASAQCRRSGERGRRPAAAPATVRLKARKRGRVRAETHGAASVETTAEMIQRCALRQPMRQMDVMPLGARTPQSVAACRPCLGQQRRLGELAEDHGCRRLASAAIAGQHPQPRIESSSDESSEPLGLPKARWDPGWLVPDGREAMMVQTHRWPFALGRSVDDKQRACSNSSMQNCWPKSCSHCSSQSSIRRPAMAASSRPSRTRTSRRPPDRTVSRATSSQPTQSLALRLSTRRCRCQKLALPRPETSASALEYPFKYNSNPCASHARFYKRESWRELRCRGVAGQRRLPEKQHRLCGQHPQHPRATLAETALKHHV